MEILKTSLRHIRSFIRLVGGLFYYMFTGKTPFRAYHSMIALFCASKGYSNDILTWIVGLVRRPYVFPRNTTGFLGSVHGDEFRQALLSLKSQGYYVFKNRLPDDLCDRLLSYATTHPCKLRPIEGEGYGEPIMATYHRDAPKAVRYEFLADDMLANPDIQLLLSDLSFAALAQDYLGARPIVDVLGLWWHTNFSDKPDAEAAQYYHFDMDRIKWLKFFVYLTDVEPENGPHSFIARSHKSGAIPPSLLSKGYARLTDEEIGQHFDKDDFREFSAPRGTIIAEDTRGLHKGKHVERGDRLVLQVQFSNCLFGGSYPKSSLHGNMIPALKVQVQKYPDLYSFSIVNE